MTDAPQWTGLLPGHERFPYTPITRRRDWRWPGGARLAVYIGFNLEHFAFGAGLGACLGPASPHPDVLNYGWREYGNRVGAWRCLELFDQLGLPAATILNTALYDHCPELVQACVDRGDELVGHGHTNAERQGGWAEAHERALLASCAERIAGESGQRPQGWLSPWISESPRTPDLLAEAGYGYVMDWAHDDQPVWLATRSGKKILAIPYARPTNDLPAMHGAKTPPALWADMMIDQFNEMLRLSKKTPLIYNFSLHPFLVGHPFRMVHLRRVIAHIAGHLDQVWWTTPGRIAAHCATLPPGTIA